MTDDRTPTVLSDREFAIEHALAAPAAKAFAAAGRRTPGRAAHLQGASAT